MAAHSFIQQIFIEGCARCCSGALNEIGIWVFLNLPSGRELILQMSQVHLLLPKTCTAFRFLPTYPWKYLPSSANLQRPSESAWLSSLPHFIFLWSTIHHPKICSVCNPCESAHVLPACLLQCKYHEDRGLAVLSPLRHSSTKKNVWHMVGTQYLFIKIQEGMERKDTKTSISERMEAGAPVVAAYTGTICWCGRKWI